MIPAFHSDEKRSITRAVLILDLKAELRMSRHSAGHAGGLDMTQEETTSTDGAMFITTPPLCSVPSWCNVQETI